MVATIKTVFGVFWATSTCFLLYLAYIVLQTEYKPQLIWAWLTMCCFTFISATWLAYNIISAPYRKPEEINQ
ncbi:MAG: hypothetical protein KKH28_00640 [Elusimicrobia bacterium]|nr:hypothetical protein [Elusimicrobiota bacterium]